MTDKPQKLFNVRFHRVQGKNLLTQHNNAYEIDGVGLMIWELCDGEHTLEQIVEAVTQDYEVDYAEALTDCRAFVDDLTAKGLLQ